MILRREAIRAAMAATTEDDTRYHMSAMQIRPDGTIEATNGHIAFRVTEKARYSDEEFPEVEEAGISSGTIESAVLLEKSAAEGLVKATAKKVTIPILTAIRVGQSQTSAVAVATDLASRNIVRLEKSDNFPNLDKVWPTPDRQVVTVRLGVPVLKALIAAAEAVGGKTVERGITFQFPTAPTTSKAVEVCGATISGPDVTIDCAVMPMRI